MIQTVHGGADPGIRAMELYPLIAPHYEAGRIPLCRADAGDCIADAGDSGCHIIYLVQGEVKIFSFSYNGRRMLLDQVGRGEFSGHISKLRGFNFDSTILARTDCLYLEFSDALFHELMGDSAFALMFYRSTSKRTYHMYRKILSLNLFSLEENAAFYFVRNQDRLTTATLEGMSEEIGMSRRSLCYILKRWRQAGLIESHGQGYPIRDLEAMERMTESIRLFYDSVSAADSV